MKESRKKQREVEEKRLTAERAAEEARRKADEVPLRYNVLFLITVYSFANCYRPTCYLCHLVSRYQCRHHRHTSSSSSLCSLFIRISMISHQYRYSREVWTVEDMQTCWTKLIHCLRPEHIKLYGKLTYYVRQVNGVIGGYNDCFRSVWVAVCFLCVRAQRTGQSEQWTTY